MKKVWVLGAGQLGRMLQHAAMPLALDVVCIDVDVEGQLEIEKDDIVTVEREHWPKTSATDQLCGHANFLNAQTLKIFSDRSIQKHLLDRLELPHAPWDRVRQDSTAEQLHQKLGAKVLLKQCSGGYDGKGQLWLNQQQKKTIADSWRNNAIAEQAIQFSEELSIIGVRNRAGESIYYPLTLNLHHEGVLLASISPVESIGYLQEQAQSILSKIMNELNYIGVMAMECFLVKGQLLINEIAPRVHNSGHWTQAGASISQFESHLRAVVDLPLADPMIKNTSIMLNILGLEYKLEWLSVGGGEVYWYGKTVREGRKLGHINLSLKETAQMGKALIELELLLPAHYARAIRWLESHLFAKN